MNAILISWIVIGIVGFIAAVFEEHETGWVMSPFDLFIVFVVCVVLGPAMYPIVYRKMNKPYKREVE